MASGSGRSEGQKPGFAPLATLFLTLRTLLFPKPAGIPGLVACHNSGPLGDGEPSAGLISALNLAPASPSAGSTGPMVLRLPEDGFIPVASYGEHPGETADGQKVVQVFNREAALGLVEDFRRRKAAGESLLVDWDHAFDAPDRKTAAAAWPTEFQVRNDGLYMRADWTADGLRDVTGGVYRFVSIAWDGAVTNDGGRKVFHPVRLRRACVALTNDPNLRGLRAVANQSSGGELPPGNPKDKMKNLAKLLGLADDATESAIHNAVKAALDKAADLVTVQNRCKELETKLAEADLAPYADLIPADRKAGYLAMLNTNRESTLAILGDLKAARNATPAQPPKKPLHSAQNTGKPDPAKVIDQAGQRERDQLAAVNNARKPGMTMAQAWEVAAQENPSLFAAPAAGQE